MEICVLEECKNISFRGNPVHSVYSDMMTDDSYTCIRLYDNEHGWHDKVDILFPETRNFIDKKFGKALRQSFFATMFGPKFIAPHRNEDTDVTTLRYQLGVIVHEQCDGTLKSKSKRHKWQYGKSVVFDTASVHSVHKTSDYQRTVLVVDFDPTFIEDDDVQSALKKDNICS